MKDVIADVLESVKFKTAVYFKHDFCGGWGMDAELSNFAQFHFVVGGNCVLYIDEDRFDLSHGDLVIFPTGYPHVIKSSEEAKCQLGSTLVHSIMNGLQPSNQEGITTSLICGHYELDRDISHFILKDLPEYIIIKNEEYERISLLFTVLNLIIDELSVKKLGYDLITIRLAEVIFISILRHYYLRQSKAKINLFKDEAIYKSVNFIHHNINKELSIEKLSRYSGISRTLFIKRFKDVVGNTPLSYIKTWRMSKAKQLLKYSELSLSEISEHSGYNSPSAFNRVFKQTFDISPKKFRDSYLV